MHLKGTEKGLQLQVLTRKCSKKRGEENLSPFLNQGKFNFLIFVFTLTVNSI